MDKLAQLKNAEVAGVISGLIDGGYLKLASENEFEALTEAVAGTLSDNWDLNEVLDKTAEVLSAVEDTEEDMDKTAEEQIGDTLANYGYLCLAKEAEEITDEMFKEAAGEYKDILRRMYQNLKPKSELGAKLWDDAHKGAAAVGKGGQAVIDTLSAKKAREMVKYFKRQEGTGITGSKSRVLQELKAPALAYAGLGTAAPGTAVLGKKKNRDAIYEKMKKVRASL